MINDKIDYSNGLWQDFEQYLPDAELIVKMLKEMDKIDMYDYIFEFHEGLCDTDDFKEFKQEQFKIYCESEDFE